MTSALVQPDTEPPKKPVNQDMYGWWIPRAWHGMRLGSWLRILFRNRLRVSPARIPLSCTVSAFAVGNSLLAGLSNLIYARRVRAVEILSPPVFIIGHWRSGTTFMHELLSLDDRFTAPTTCQCLLPNHFLLTEWMLTRYFKWAVPKKRSMDNVDLRWDSPQEDEFALLNLGIPSPYARMAFPLHPAPHLNYLDMTKLSDDEIERWRTGLTDFLKKVLYRLPGRLTLKSPTHTGRIATLAAMFPGAKFIHLTRDPYALFSSTMRLWKSLDIFQAFQVGDYEAKMRDEVLAALPQMYRGFNQGLQQLSAGDICEIRYDELARDPVGQVRAAYEQLGLEEFERVEPRLLDYAEGKKDYRPNQNRLDKATQAVVADRWAEYFQQFGYSA